MKRTAINVLRNLSNSKAVRSASNSNGMCSNVLNLFNSRRKKRNILRNLFNSCQKDSMLKLLYWKEWAKPRVEAVYNGLSRGMLRLSQNKAVSSSVLRNLFNSNTLSLCNSNGMVSSVLRLSNSNRVGRNGLKLPLEMSREEWAAAC